MRTLPREVWFTVWGSLVALLIQLSYDLFGRFGENIQFTAGVLIAVIILLVLVIWKPKA